MNKAGAELLSAEECESSFALGAKQHTASASSDGVGLHNVQQAVSVAGGHAQLRAQSSGSARGECTTFSVKLPVELASPGDGEASALLSSDDETPSEQCPEDSSDAEVAGAPDGLLHQATAHAGAKVATAAPVALAGPSSESAQAPSSLVCAALDDDSMARMMHTQFFSAFLHADPARSIALGADEQEQLSFVDVALGRKHASLQDAVPPLPPADIVLLDQNIDLHRREHLLGSDVAGQLLTAGYRGVTCIITGSSLEQIQRLSAQPGVDLVVPKGTNLAELAADLREIHEEKKHDRSG